MSEELNNVSENKEAVEEIVAEVTATTEETKPTTEESTAEVVEEKVEASQPDTNKENVEAPRGRISKKPFNKNYRSRAPRAPREKPEFDSKAILVRRVTRVTSGGRRFSLHVTMVAGDRNGRVGLGVGKALDTQAAMEKALKDAKKNMIKFDIDEKKTIKHEVTGKYDTAEIWISPNNEKGLIAGSSARVILSLAGLQNVTAKFHGGTKNKLNNARAAMRALSKVAKRA
ncbi:MAG: small subunit ribosomal protein [Patescibacteria group bacterium]|nr:small subunit ribosomal protein [Patescibacteria group bacterium]